MKTYMITIAIVAAVCGFAVVSQDAPLTPQEQIWANHDAAMAKHNASIALAEAKSGPKPKEPAAAKKPVKRSSVWSGTPCDFGDRAPSAAEAKKCGDWNRAKNADDAPINEDTAQILAAIILAQALIDAQNN